MTFKQLFEQNQMVRGLTIALILLCIFFLVTSLLLFVNYENDKNTIKLTGQHHVNLIRETITNDLKNVYSDVQFLADHHEVRRFFVDSSNEHAKYLAQDFLAFSTIKGKYDQVRLLDATGMEIIRVDYNDAHSVIVPKDKLQFKGKRYYFNDAFKLQHREIFVSPFDLNMERGSIEQPLKPMIRFATPVFDNQNNKLGIIVLNYFGANLLQKIEALSNNTVGKTMLVNSDGYWLKHWEPQREWGFMLAARQDEKMPNVFSEEWLQIAGTKSNQLKSANGLFVFTSVYPAKKSVMSEVDFWKIVYYVPTNDLWKNSIQLLTTLLGIGLPLFIILGISLFKWLNAKIKQTQTEQYCRKQNVAFARFVPTHFLQLLGKQDIIEVEPGDQTEQEMTILVANIVGFTGLSEAITARETINFINTYLKQVEPIIRTHNGFVTNYIGDKFTALFPTDCEEAINAALAMLTQLRKYNEERQQNNLLKVRVNLGIDTGKLLLGTIGGSQRLGSVVIGDAVSSAFFMESMNKNYGTTLLISERTYSTLKTPSQYGVRFIDRVKPKGMVKTLSVYDVFSMDAPDVYALKLANLNTFGEAVSYYQFQQIDKASDLFEEIVKQVPNDKAAQVYLQRCYKYASSGQHDGLSDITRTITWSNSLAIGIPLIDQQHHDLIDNINALIEAIRAGKGQEHIKKTTAFLEDYLVRHFNDEEALMQEYNYPGYPAHKVLHLNFVEAFNGLKVELHEKADKGLYLVFKVQTLVMDWFVNHIAKVDKQIAVFLNTQLEKYNRTLEAKVAARTQALKEREAQLEEAKKAAESANKAKSDFLANMSHEIRTPMNAITGLTWLALKTELTDKQQDYLTKIDNSAQALLGIINDILDFSKIEAGMLEIEAVDFHLDDVLDNLSSLFGLRVEERGLEFLLAIDKKVPRYLVGDPLRLGQILINLTNNALKFTEQGEIVIKVEAVNSEARQVTLQFSVQDTGIGIAAEVIPNLFSAFTQADTSTTRKFGGTGLGLTICKRLTKLMGGKIWIESQLGKGSSFNFTVVFDHQTDIPKTNLQMPNELSGIKILVVDDNQTSLEIMQDELGSFGFETSSVSSGKAALAELEAVAKSQPYDLVLLDWKMPGMDGIETAKRIKEDSRLPQKPTIIMMTAFSREDTFKKEAKNTFDAYLVKPITQSTLFDTVMSVFGKQIVKTSRSLQKQASIVADINSLHGARVLLAEDNIINQQIAREIITNEGLIVEIVNNGKEAMAMVAERNFDAVLMDIQMPEMDGFEATRLIRQQPQFEELPIIAMTAHAMSGDRDKCLAAGMSDYVTKPIDVEQLFSTLKKWIKPEETVLSSGSIPPLKEEIVEKLEPEKNQKIILPNELPCLDVELALKRLGDQELLHSLLKDFHRDYKNAASDLRDVLNKQDLATAKLLAHSLKGVAANLSALQLQSAVQDLEKALKPDKLENTTNLLENVELALVQLLEFISTLIEEPEPYEIKETSPKTPLDVSAITPLLVELAKLLKMGNTRAEITLQSLKAEIKGSKFTDELNQMETCMDRFDFNGAQVHLNAIANALEFKNL